MARNFGAAKLKNHIPNNAPGTLGAMGRLFDVSESDFNKALHGDQTVITRIADMARLSDTAKANLPKALEAYRKIIESATRWLETMNHKVPGGLALRFFK